MKIQSKLKEYTVHFKADFGFVAELLEDPNAYFVVDKLLYELYAEAVFKDLPPDRMQLLEAVEPNKTAQTALEICERMTAIPAKRNARLISFGGGIIQDVTGFAANILYRGVHWTFVPTTLLAACDSCIGGKTSLNYKGFKNLLGTFYPPDDILICSRFFHTLTEKDFQSGLGEVTKFNILTGEKGLEALERDLGALLAREDAAVDRYVESSLAFKKPFVEADEFDRGERIKLNYAHTFGHAIETVTQYGIPHGTAVAIGTIMANQISVRRGMLAEAAAKRMEALLVRVVKIKSGISLDFDVDTMVDAIKNDKKRRGKGLTAILLDGQYQLHLVDDLEPGEVAQAVQYTAALLS